LKNTDTPALKIGALVKRYNDNEKQPIIDHIDLTVDQGEMLVLLGPSGCGKTTLLRCIAGLERAQSGSIDLAGSRVFDAGLHVDVPTHRRDIGMVFQNYSLWPHMTVRGNVEYPLRARRQPASLRDMRVSEVLKTVQCTHLADRHPSMLSGGQQQRVALARALAPRPSLMLLDEPLSNLDTLLRDELRTQLRNIHRELRFTGIYVTHDQTEAFTLGTRVAVMNAGRIEQLGSAAEVNAKPGTEYVARFLGICNDLTLSNSSGWASDAGALTGDLTLLPDIAGEVRLYVRPENLTFSASGTTLPSGSICLGEGRIKDAIVVGHETDYVVGIGNKTLRVKQSNATKPYPPETPLNVVVAHRNVLLYRNGQLIERTA